MTLIINFPEWLSYALAVWIFFYGVLAALKVWKVILLVQLNRLKKKLKK